MCALVAFRQTFASITDFRFNHILLPRATSLFHRQPFLPIQGRGPYYSYQIPDQFASHDLPFTREGGWGHGGGEQGTGAPGDATVLGLSLGSEGFGGGGFGGQTGGYGGHELGQIPRNANRVPVGGNVNTLTGTGAAPVGHQAV